MSEDALENFLDIALDLEDKVGDLCSESGITPKTLENDATEQLSFISNGILYELWLYHSKTKTKTVPSYNTLLHWLASICPNQFGNMTIASLRKLLNATTTQMKGLLKRGASGADKVRDFKLRACNAPFSSLPALRTETSPIHIGAAPLPTNLAAALPPSHLAVAPPPGYLPTEHSPTHLSVNPSPAQLPVVPSIAHLSAKPVLLINEPSPHHRAHGLPTDPSLHDVPTELSPHNVPTEPSSLGVPTEPSPLGATTEPSSHESTEPLLSPAIVHRYQSLGKYFFFK